MNSSEIDKAVAVLRAGGLVAFPTETVYGLGADAANEVAVRKIYALKGRPAGHPVIVHLADFNQMSQWTSDITPAAKKLAQHFWPGPLTLILRRAAGVSDAVTGGQDTVGLRVPSHPLAQRLLARFGAGIAAPSANRFGHISATTAQHVTLEFGDGVDLVIDGGQSEVGIESTIVDVTGDSPVLLRPGHISAQQIECAAEVPLAAQRSNAPRVPGNLVAHYAPNTPLIVVAGTRLTERVLGMVSEGKRVAVLSRQTSPLRQPGVSWISAPLAAADYAHDFYANLRRLDEEACTRIMVEQLPQTPAWTAVNDRLDRAAAGSGLP